MKIKDLPDSSKPRERFLKYGPEVLSDAELFAIILRTGTKQENVITVANNLISEYGLDHLFSCSVKELRKIKGIGETKAIELLTVAELAKRYSQYKKPLKHIQSAKDVFELYRDKLGEEKQENFYVLLLSNKNNILGENRVSVGLLDCSLTHPREIFKPAIRNSASRVILIHNHPSGDPMPSQEDKSTTEKLIESGNLLGIHVLDHVIIGKDTYWSWKDSKNS